MRKILDINTVAFELGDNDGSGCVRQYSESAFINETEVESCADLTLCVQNPSRINLRGFQRSTLNRPQSLLAGVHGCALLVQFNEQS
jgi:hypothetical protein